MDAQTEPDRLPSLEISSERIANQLPAGALAMPVSALRYEPQLDIQARNLGEAQADITIRGGAFESAGIKLGALSLGDPQTGHYLAEIPIAPEMLASPRIVTGSELALAVSNATAGAIAYGWRPIRTGGVAALSSGEGHFASASAYQGFAGPAGAHGVRWGGDASWGKSRGDGLVAFGDHDFERVNVRIQRRSLLAQTDFFAGYQEKAFGWLNLYTPFNSPESENLQTVLIALNHRAEFSSGDSLEGGIFYRRNKDDYAFNRFAALSNVHPFQHTTWLSGAAVSGRKTLGEFAIEARVEFSSDELESTSLTFGRYHTRDLAKLALVAGRSWQTSDGSRVHFKAGGTVDRSNRSRTAWTPVLEVSRDWSGTGLARVFASASGASQLPSYTALNSNPNAGLFRGNSALGRQKTRNVEAGLMGNFSGWSLQMAAFHRSDDDLVDWTYRRGVTARTANAVNVATLGFELLARRSWTHADLVLGYTALSKDADYKTAAVDASFYALNYAKHRLTAALIYRFNREWVLHLDNTARLQADNPLRLVGGDETLSSALGVIFKPGTWRGVSVSLRADNLWCSNYQDVPAVPAAPRQISLGLGYAW